jgi:hypothetical protein
MRRFSGAAVWKYGRIVPRSPAALRTQVEQQVQARNTFAKEGIATLDSSVRNGGRDGRGRLDEDLVVGNLSQRFVVGLEEEHDGAVSAGLPALSGWVVDAVSRGSRSAAGFVCLAMFRSVGRTASPVIGRATACDRWGGAGTKKNIPIPRPGGTPVTHLGVMKRRHPSDADSCLHFRMGVRATHDRHPAEHPTRHRTPPLSRNTDASKTSMGARTCSRNYPCSSKVEALLLGSAAGRGVTQSTN